MMRRRTVTGIDPTHQGDSEAAWPYRPLRRQEFSFIVFILLPAEFTLLHANTNTACFIYLFTYLFIYLFFIVLEPLVVVRPPIFQNL